MAGLSVAVREYRFARIRDFLETQGCDALALSSTEWFEWMSNCEIHEHVPERPIILVVTASGQSFTIISELSRHAVTTAAKRGALWIDTVHHYPECPHQHAAGRTLREWPQIVAEVLSSAGLAQARIAVDNLTKPFALVAELLRGLQWIEPGEALHRLRWCKHQDEVATMRRAAALSVWAIDAYREEMRPGRFLKEIDYQVAARLSAEAGRTLPGENFVISSIFTLSGVNSSSPKGDGVASGKVLEKDTIAITTIGTRLNGLAAEIIRPWLTGSPPREVLRLLDVTQAAQLASIDAAVAGRPVRGIHEAALAVYERAGVAKRYCLRAGHGIGVVMHDFPTALQFEDRELLAGETYAIEPSVCVPGVGGFRFSDSIVVGATRPGLITPQKGERIGRIAA